MRVVLDTNVLVSAFIKPRGTAGRLLRHRHLFTVVISAEILDELRQTLHYQHIRKNYAHSDQSRIDYIRAIRYESEYVTLDQVVEGVSSDPDDDKFLSCALSAEADLIVSADSDLYELMAFRGIPIMQPYQFLELLQNI